MNFEKIISVDLAKKNCDVCKKGFKTRRRYLNHIRQYGYNTILNGRKVRILGSKD